jgi:ABC-type siderophore export system fused ATPase/permease subunit
MKELKLHAARREAFLSERIATATEDLRRHALAGIRHHIVADTWSQILFYGLLGGLLFTAPSAQGANTATVFYLFDSLLGLRGDDLDARAHRHLVELELDAKIQIRDGVFSTTALSQGQRKRLALLTAFLEDRPIYVFDEWAADQDSHYREVFYKRLLPELKGLGKTILVISHDDRYYHLGDRIVKLEYGKLAAERGPEDRHRDPTVDVAK